MAEKKITEVTSVSSLGDGDSIFVNSGDALCQLDKEQALLNIKEYILSNIGRIEFVKLWENASPSSEFAAQTIGLDLSEYDWVYFVARESTTADTELGVIARKNQKARVTFLANYRQTRVIFVEETGIYVYGGNAGAYNAATSSNDAACIPVIIYGIKGVQ